MIYCVDPSVDEPIMLLNKHIGMDAEEGMGIDGSLFQSELLALDSMGKKRIQVWINSPGGSVMDGMAIYDAMLKIKTKVDTYCSFMAASIAAVIFQAGRNRTMADYALLMYHNPYGVDDKDTIAKMKASLVTAIAQRGGHDEGAVSKVLDRTTWMNANEAKALGFCDTIEASADYNRKRAIPVAGDAKAMIRVGNLIMNSILNKEVKSTKMIKVTNKLKLNNDASEDSILEAITSMENKYATEVKNAADAMKELQDKCKAQEEELCKTKDALAALQTEKEKADKEKKDAEDAKTAAEAKNMLEDFVKTGRIATDSIPKWTEMVNKIGKDEVKALIEELPLNKTAPKLGDAVNKLQPGEAPTTAVQMMANIKAKAAKK